MRLRIDLRLGIAGGQDRGDHVGWSLGRCHEIPLPQLDLAPLSQVPDAEVAVAEGAEGLLGTIDLREHDGIHFGAVRDARRETGRRGIAGFSALGIRSSAA